MLGTASSKVFGRHWPLLLLRGGCLKEGLAAIEQFGGEAFNHREEDYQEKIIQATGGKGVNVILEMLSNVNLGKSLSYLGGIDGLTSLLNSKRHIQACGTSWSYCHYRLPGQCGD